MVPKWGAVRVEEILTPKLGQLSGVTPLFAVALRFVIESQSFEPVMFTGESPFYDRAVIVEAVIGFSLFSIDGALLGYALVNPSEFR